MGALTYYAKDVPPSWGFWRPERLRPDLAHFGWPGSVELGWGYGGSDLATFVFGRYSNGGEGHCYHRLRPRQVTERLSPDSGGN